jgi:hypothetical protein
MEPRLYAPEELIGFREAAKLAGVTRMTLRRWHDIGRLHCVKIGHQHFTTRPELKRAVEAMASSSVKHQRVGAPSPELMAEEAIEYEAEHVTA